METAMYISLPYSAGNVSTSWRNVSFYRRALLRVVFCVKNHEDISKARAAYAFRLKSSGLDKHTYREEHEATRNIKSNSKRILHVHIKPHMEYDTMVCINKTGNVRITQNSGAFVLPSLQWENNNYYIFWVCVCSLRYPPWNAHAPYCHLWPVRLYNIFPRYLINGKVFDKKLLNTKCVFWFSLQLLLETFSFADEFGEKWTKIYIGLHVKYPLFLSHFNETRVFLTYFRKTLKYQISWKSGKWEPSCYMRTARLTRRRVKTKLSVAFRNDASTSNRKLFPTHIFKTSHSKHTGRKETIFTM
jgi:hypothetical protein